jgi:hypothetical protein
MDSATGNLRKPDDIHKDILAAIEARIFAAPDAKP